MEVDNWQFAWAEEQKKACCKTVGLGSPKKVRRKGGTFGGVFKFKWGEECFWMDFFFGAFKKEKTSVFFF